MLAVSLLCNCSNSLAMLNSAVTLFQGKSTAWPSFSSCWNKCMCLCWRIDALASTGGKFSLPSIKASQIPSPSASLNVCWASWNQKKKKKKSNQILRKDVQTISLWESCKEILIHQTLLQWVFKPRILPFQNGELQYYWALQWVYLHLPFLEAYGPTTIFRTLIFPNEKKGVIK